MLFNLDGSEIDRMPHGRDYDLWRARLSDEDHAAIIEELHRIMEEKIECEEPGGEGAIFKSSFLPGSDWTGTVNQPIYDACGEDWDAARKFYGLLVWEAVQSHGERWHRHKEERDDGEPTGTTYFRPRD